MTELFGTMKICFVRHGETEWNNIGLIQGQKDIPLNQIGVKQAQQCGIYLNQQKWACIASSPLQRAVKTAEVIAKIIDNKNLIIHNELTERCFGILEGEKYTELNSLDLEKHGVEDEERVKKRMEHVVENLAAQFYPNNIVIVTHGSALKQYLKSICTSVSSTHLSNGSISQVSFNGHSYTVDFVNKITFFD